MTRKDYQLVAAILRRMEPLLDRYTMLNPETANPVMSVYKLVRGEVIAGLSENDKQFDLRKFMIELENKE